ncbi:MAPEG family protein [Yunchengibacter salinarum]|uniref:MAPEG family protein n=1 Tax=Yunchengibacter salinarum TaxID=3133399 RepID=UPI0035B67CD0
MTTDLTMLFLSTILYFVLIIIPAYEAIRRNGRAAQAGPRDDLPPPSTFNLRATRLHQNMQENLLIFAVLVLTAHVAGVQTPLTMLGAQVFFYARVIHAVIYLAGWPWVRPLAWLAGVIGMVLVALPMV